MVDNQNLSRQLREYFNERSQRETDFHNARLELEDLLIEEPGLVCESGICEEPSGWPWIGDWVSYFSPKEAFEWIKAGIFEPKEAYQMKQEGQSPADGRLDQDSKVATEAT